MGFLVILQVVGYQNSGKTTLITKLLERLELQGIRAGVIKHHGHDEHLQLQDSGKDTERHRNAGAAITCISSKNNTVLSMNSSLPLEKVIEMYKIVDIECILIEGYKQIQYPRVVLCKNKDDQSLIAQSTDIIAIVSEEVLSKENSHPFFFWHDKENWVTFLSENITAKVSKEKRCNHETI